MESEGGALLLPQLFLKARRRRLRGGAAAGSGAV